ncbi:galaxin [Oreochromis niloticus]|uniref:galaxin n=1 Tax=Oreochromis niloticus TaxID=8128 RepID=UPI000DF16C0B|nr:galaxin [Oreochromis niloticus]XP_039454108.1 galaxin-like [Oreochromis aureus]
MAECCGKDVFDKVKQLCCGSPDIKMILMRNSSHHQCCGHSQYDTETQCCCSNEEKRLEVQPKISSCCLRDSTSAHLCGNETYDKNTQLCCQSTVIDKRSPNHRCCDKRAYDVEKELCCGPISDKKILTRNSPDHMCCHQGQFNSKTECCCWKDDGAEIQPRNSSCCMQQEAPVFQPNCTEPNTHLCGSTCYNPKEHHCCERNQKPHWFCTSGQSKATPTVYNPHIQVCCDGCMSTWKPWMDQCCGETPYGSGQRRVLCCNNTLYEDRDDGEECSGTGIPYNPAKGTICCSQFHGSPGQHCCGTEIYRPDVEICCNGHRHPKSENIHCCGVKAYNIKDPQMKCCAGSLYNLTSLDKHGGDAQCCGSTLQKPQDICCSSEDKEVIYSAKTGFKCCGHLYYNTALWSCCAGRLRSIHEPGQGRRKMINESKVLSVNNLNKTDLCQKIYIGTVESVSQQSVVFGNVLKVHGMKTKVKALPFPYILETDDRCSSPKLILGKTYFFNKVNVFTDFNHDSVLQSLHVIICKCSP